MEDCKKAWTHIGWEDAMHFMVRMAGVHVEERGGRTSGGDASAQGGEDDPDCRRKCWTSSSKHKANDVEGEEYILLEKEKEWSVHRQCDEEMQSLQDEPWRNEELRVCEEALPRLKEGDLAEASRFFKAKTGVGCDGFHPEVFLDDKNGRRTCGILGESGEWPQQACTTMFFLIPKDVTSDRLIDSLVGSLESTRSGEVAAEVSSGLGRHGLSKRRRSANSVGSIDGNGKI